MESIESAPFRSLPFEHPRVKVRASRGADVACAFPWSYSRGLRRCICTREGYSLQHGSCAPMGASALCRDNERWSGQDNACVCAGGLHREGEACVGETPITAAVAPAEGEPQATPPSPASEESPRAAGTKRAQRCFAQLGLYRGPIDGAASRDTWTAYWYFKHANGLVIYRDFLAAPVQEKIAALCKDDEEAATLTTEPVPAPATAEETRSPLPVAQEIAMPRKTSLDIDCLPADLLTLLRRSHGRAVTVKACEPVCLPAPRGLDQSELAALEARSGIDWCSSCVAIDGRLALEDVQRIERASNVKLCATPPKQLPRHLGSTEAGEKAYTRVRELYRSLPPGAENETAIAIVIGNRNYATLPASETSRNDADAIYSVLTEHLGYLQDNVILLRDAKRADFDRVLGTASEPGGELAGLVRAHPGATVLVYYSGLGATDAAQTETYLLPVDAERYREERSGYPLASLYAALSQLDAKSVLVLLEAEFGRDHGAYVLPPNVPEMMKSVLPDGPLGGLTVLAAADRGQRTLVDLSYDIGLFTRYLIEGLAGNADLAPIGNGDGKLDSSELYVFTADMVQLAARKTYGLLQNPVYSSASAAVVSAGGSGPLAAKP
jgi:Caspase domain